MKNLLKLFLFVIVSLTFTQCNKTSTGSSSSSSLTGWKFNDPKYGNFLKGKYSKSFDKPPSGMVAVEGGTFTMGQVQDDVMFEWNTTPNKIHIRSFYMDEAEVTNSEYSLFLQYTKMVFPPEDERYKHIYTSILPDTLVWRKSLGNTELLSYSYLRHPAYSDYPVVGVSWLQATQYCKWRTNAVNLKILMDRGVIKNIFTMDSLEFKGKNNFDTGVYLNNPYVLFDGDSTIYKKGLPIKRKKGVPKPAKEAFKGRHITSSDGILSQKYRLPTEAEWEYAAKSLVENRELNNLKGRKKYAWSGNNTKHKRKIYKGDQLANFKQSKGNYSGLSGWSGDGADITIKIKSYPPNAFGLYDMSGNVAEWVADVYRVHIDSEANDFNYFRGNVFTKKMIDKEGKVVIVDDNSVEYDTLNNGKIVPKYLPGSIKYTPVTKREIAMRKNYSVADNSDINDGDRNSSRYYELDSIQFSTAPKMYNSPKAMTIEKDGITDNVIVKYDEQSRTTLISNKARVYKGGSWNDREYWLDPAQRRYLPEYMSTSYIGFRCVTDRIVSSNNYTRKKRNSKR